MSWLHESEDQLSHSDSSRVGQKSFVETQIILQQSQFPQFQVHPIMANPPTIIDLIIETRYARLDLPQNLNAFHVGDYQKYLPKYNGEGQIIVEEHIAPFIVL